MRNSMCVKKCVWVASILCVLAFFSCSDAWKEEAALNNQRKVFVLSGSISQQNESRANANGFVDGDRMGVYIVDYNNGLPGTLSATDNRASNVLYTFNGLENSWKSAVTLYWKDQTTPVDVYGYYPGVNYIDSPTAYAFEVSHLQNVVPEEGEISNYEASDFLWGKVEKVNPTEETIMIRYQHRMAGIQVTLQLGENMVGDEFNWAEVDKKVQINQVRRSASIDLTTGVPVATGEVDKSIQMMKQENDVYRAVIVPQEVAAQTNLFTLVVDGKNYPAAINENINFQSGKLYQFNYTLYISESTGTYELMLTGIEISDWINDQISHNFTASQYVIIHCPESGQLENSIQQAGYDYQKMKNLKITGYLNDKDFELLRSKMPKLEHLNLKEVEIPDRLLIYSHWFDGPGTIEKYRTNALPINALYGNKTIKSLVLPKSITHIGSNALREMNLMYSTLEIPEGVLNIEEGALAFNEENGVELVLPLSLDSIGSDAFCANSYRCEFRLSDKIKYIADGAFYECKNFYGTFQIPSKLTVIKKEAFGGVGVKNNTLDGNIEIAQGVTKIEERAFYNMGFANRLNLTFPPGLNSIEKQAFSGVRLSSLRFNDDLEEVGSEAFYNAHIPFQITLPSQLKIVGRRGFLEARIEGELVIPESCLNLGEGAFAGNNFTKITLPKKLEMIPRDCFNNLKYLKEINIPKYVDYIGHYAFNGDNALETIICMNPEPPSLGDQVFDGVDKEKAILQVPERSVGLYRNTSGWNQFKNITAYHELAFNISEIKTLDKGMTRVGIIRSEGDWEVSYCPNWITVSPMEGPNKAEVTITVNEQTPGAGEREDKIVFKLKDKDYTTYTNVKQFSSTEIVEDKMIVLQPADAGAPKAVPLFIIGDGYDAEEILSGKYLEDMNAQMNHFFSIEPYKSYQKYFTVSTAIVCSPDSGIEGDTKFKSEVFDGLRGDADKVWEYAKTYGEGFSTASEGDCTVMVLLNTVSTANYTDIERNGRTVSWVGKSNDSYPFDQKSQVLREVGGVAFGKLAPEGVNHFTFIKSCTCPHCNMLSTYQDMQREGWYKNITLSANMNEAPWKHYIFNSNYSSLVDMYEGALRHARGAYRSENMSIMGNTYIPYFNTISREIIVRRIMQCAEKEFSMDEFLANDKIEILE